MSPAEKKTMPPKKPESNVKTALRVIEIIEIFAREATPLSLSELARHLDAPVSSCLALLRTLTNLGHLYAAGRSQGFYPPGRLLAIAQRISSADPILDRLLHHGTWFGASSVEMMRLGKLVFH